MGLLDIDASQLKLYHEHRTETYKSMIAISLEIFKYLAVLNGGAAAGTLSAFPGLQKIIDVGVLRFSIGCFVAGLTLNGLAVMCAYLTQLNLFTDSIRQDDQMHHVPFIKASIAFCVLSLFAFCAGALSAGLNAH